MKRAYLLAAMLVAVPRLARADGLESRVLVIPVSGASPTGLGPLVGDVEKALGDGARQLSPNVSLATASLDDTAGIVGCDPSEAACLDAIAAALNVDQLLIAEVSGSGGDATIEVTAVTRETEPVRRSFVIHRASRDSDVKQIADAVSDMLEAGEARKAEAAQHKDQPPPPPEEHPVVVVTAPAAHSPLPLYTIGGGGGLLLIGGVFWALAGNQQAAIDSAPTATAQQLDHLADLESTARTEATVGNVLVIGGAVVAAAGLAWYVLDHRHRESDVQVAPAVVPGGAGVTIGGAW